MSATPRLAATMIVVRDDPFEVLMVKRPPTGTFPSAWVFPGGSVDNDDFDFAWSDCIEETALGSRDRALRIAAVRETYEETALVVAAGSTSFSHLTNPLPLRDALASAGARLSLDSVIPFAHWVTPESVPRRFDTHFFLVSAPPDQRVVADGAETINAEWVSPGSLVDRSRAGEILLFFPTLTNLRLLEANCSVSAAMDAASGRSVVTVHPRTVERADGSRSFELPDEAAEFYGYAHTRGSGDVTP